MKTNRIALALLSLNLFLAAAGARAELPEAPKGTTEASGSYLLSDQVYADFFTNFHGSSLSEIGSSRAMTPEGKLGRPSTVNFDSELGMGYKLSESVSVGAVVPFLIFPAPGDHFTLGDVGLKVSQQDTVNWRGLRVSSALILQAPTSNLSRDRSMNLGIKAVPTLRYDFPDSDFSIGALNEIKEYLGAKQGATFKLWTLPYLRYNLSRSLALKLAYELELRHFARSDARLSHYQHDLQPSLSWKVSRTVSVNPYLQFFRLDAINTANTGVGAIVTATLL